MQVNFTLNGKKTTLDVAPMSRLLDVLREDLGLTGSKEGCGEGECGACTVKIDGQAACSCLVPVIQVEGTEVVTVEGLAQQGNLAPVQAAFLACGAAQCGICTPGFLVMASELLEKNAHPSKAEVREALSGNLCRCTGYQKIVEAVCVAMGASAVGGA